MRMLSARESGPPATVNRYLLPRERQVITVRMHPAALIGPGLAASGGVLAAWKLARDSGRPDIAWGASVPVLLECARRMAAWPVTYIVITSERVLIISGLLTRTVTSISLDEVQGLTFRRSVLGRLLGLRLAGRYFRSPPAVPHGQIPALPGTALPGDNQTSSRQPSVTRTTKTARPGNGQNSTAVSGGNAASGLSSRGRARGPIPAVRAR